MEYRSIKNMILRFGLKFDQIQQPQYKRDGRAYFKIVLFRARLLISVY